MWLPMLLLALMASGSACPDFCQCRPPVIVCSCHAPNLTQLDELTTTNYTEFRIHEVEQEELRAYIANMPNSTFLRRLEAIEVTNCSTLTNHHYLKWDVPPGEIIDFPVLPNVRLLNISHNKLTDLPGRRTADGKVTKQLRFFDVSHNQIYSIVTVDFKCMPQLTWLSLASNNLNYISPTQFRYLQSLEYLDLSDNQLHMVEGIFDSLRSLQRLNIAGNKVKYVEANMFQDLSKLVELDISRNKLMFISADTLQPLASLSVFKLAENPLIQRDLSLLLGTGRRLEIVDASRIGLVRVPPALTRSVRTLKLAGNQLTSINSGDLDSYPLLRLLDLSGNRLMIIEEDALGRLDGLEELILSGNILPTIPKSLPSGLKIFDLKQNAISKLKANDLQGLYLLKELNLSGNVISVIEGGSFRQLPALEVLDISDNPIKKLPSDTLSGPSNLITLRMSGLMSLKTEENQNQDTAFPILTPERLVTLDVSRSPALAAQLLADNAALSACKSLQELDLSYTNISAMRSDLAYVLPQLKKLNLIGNEWNCSTDQFWLGEWIRQHQTSIKFSTRCTTPIDLEGKPLEEMPSLSITQLTTTKLDNVQAATSIKPENKVIISRKIYPAGFPIERKELKSDDNYSSTPKTTTNVYSTVSSSSRTTADSHKIVSTSPTSRPITTTQSLLNEQDMEKESTAAHNTSTISPFISYQTEEPTTATNEEQWSSLSTIKDTEEDYTSKVINYEATRHATETIATIDLSKSNQDTELVSTTSSIDNSDATIKENKEVTNNFLTAKTTLRDLEATTTTNAPSTASITSPDAYTTSTTKVSYVKSNQPAIIRAEEILMKKYKDLKEAATMNDKKSANRVISELSGSKLLLAKEQPRVNDEPNSVAEELNSQATESGARTSESIATGAHPGMLVLLGAAIGAAAALTVVFSRHATVKRRDRQYQRHENIEVHALTPTTELW